MDPLGIDLYLFFVHLWGRSSTTIALIFSVASVKVWKEMKSGRIDSGVNKSRFLGFGFLGPLCSHTDFQIKNNTWEMEELNNCFGGKKKKKLTVFIRTGRSDNLTAKLLKPIRSIAIVTSLTALELHRQWVSCTYVCHSSLYADILHFLFEFLFTRYWWYSETRSVIPYSTVLSVKWNWLIQSL